MNVKNLTEYKSVMRLAIIFSIFTSAFGVFLMFQMDNTIHRDLYNYGLQFSLNWALPTWTLERLLGVCFILPMIFGATALVWDIRRSRSKDLTVKRVESKPQQLPQYPQHQPQQPQQQPKQQPQPPPVSRSNNGVKAQALRENSMVISCPSCRKMFGKPLVMLDFSNKKTQLVNVCPYCNAILGTARDEVEREDIDVGVLDTDEKTEKSRK